MTRKLSDSLYVTVNMKFSRCVFAGYLWRYLTSVHKVGLLNSRTCIAKEINCLLLENAKLKWFELQNFHQIAEFKPRSLNMHTSKSRNKRVAKISCNKVDIPKKFACANEEWKTFWKIRVKECAWLNDDPLCKGTSTEMSILSCYRL